VSTTGTQPSGVDDTRHEGYAVGWLTLGLVCGGLGGLIGVYLVLRSTRWSPRWKAAALVLPVTLIVLARTFPESVPGWAAVSVLLITIALVYRAAHVLEEAAQRGSGQRRANRAVALVIAVLAVSIASNLEERLHPIGSYDLVQPASR
jgi:predicted MFS family arabinose efflux permease